MGNDETKKENWGCSRLQVALALESKPTSRDESPGRNGVLPRHPFRRERRFAAAFNLDRHPRHGLHPFGSFSTLCARIRGRCEWPYAHELSLGANARADVHWRDETDAIEPAVELVAHPGLLGKDRGAERGEEREAEHAVRDGSAELRARAGSVNPLVVLRALGERVHAGLVYGAPFAGSQGGAHHRRPILGGGHDAARRGRGGGIHVRRERDRASTRRVHAIERRRHGRRAREHTDCGAPRRGVPTRFRTLSGAHQRRLKGG